MRDRYTDEKKVPRDYRIDDDPSSDDCSAYDKNVEGRQKDPWLKVFCPEKNCEITESSDLP